MQTIYYIDRYGNIDRTGFRYKKTPTVKIYPVTLVNLVGGIASSFEYDSDGNGLADGWSITTTSGSSYSLTTGIVGNYAQQRNIDNTEGSSILYNELWRKVYYPSSTIFVSVYIKKTSDDTSVNAPYIALRGYDADEAWIDTLYVTAQNSQNWHRICGMYTFDPDVVRYTFMITQKVEAGEYGSYAVDAALMYDLKAMGTLPPPLQQLYSATYWYELSEEQLVALLPFCPGVCSLGFAWESDV